MTEQIQNDIDSITTFLKNAGWRFGWCIVEENGRNVWKVDAVKGKMRFEVRHKTLKRGLMLVRNLVLGMN